MRVDSSELDAGPIVRARDPEDAFRIVAGLQRPAHAAQNSKTLAATARDFHNVLSAAITRSPVVAVLHSLQLFACDLGPGKLRYLGKIFWHDLSNP